MRFAQDAWLWGVLASLLLAVILALQGVRNSRDRARFGSDAQVQKLLTGKTGVRRAIRGVLLLLAVALCFIAAAGPQYGKGTRVLPATNLDVVLVLDYSKSMYARDVSPSRIGRAKVEMARMIRELGGARFGAVAFAGESISFPLTSDGAAIATFFRGLEPNDLPVGGTAIARALESGRQLLLRDPLSKNHERVMILVTDGEDLEGDPVSVAQAAQADGIRVDVVQIGGLSPEPIPNIDDNGTIRGMRTDSSGRILTTSLTAEGEAQLRGVSEQGGGTLVRAKTGDVGIEEMTRSLRKLMTEELSERVETVFADVFHYPLGLAVLLLLLEVFIGEAKPRVRAKDPPRDRRRRRKPRRMTGSVALLALFSLGCDEVDQVFERESPVVNQAIEALGSEAPDKAIELLTSYLETGPCEAGVIGAGDRARSLGDASYDLGLAFSAFSKTKKSPSGDPTAALQTGQLPLGTLPGAGPGAAPGTAPGAGAGATSNGPQGAEAPQVEAVDCALRLLAAISGDIKHPTPLRSRSYYLAGNLELARGEFESAVASYDLGLSLAPGAAEGKADPIGISLARNRAIALRLQKEKEEQEKKEKEKEQNSSEEDDQNQEDGDQEDGDQEDGDQEDGDQEDGDQEDGDQEDGDQEDGDQEDGDQEDGDQEDGDQEDGDQQDQQNGDQEDGDQQDQQDQQNGDQEDGDQQDQQDQQNGEPSDGDPEAASSQSPSEARDERMLDLLEQAPTLQQHDAQRRKGQRVRGRATMEDK